jgi:hypothetical protein
MWSILLFQLVVEKMLAAEGTKRTDLGREAFVARVWEWKAKYGGTITNQLRRLGASCDWARERFTLDDKLSGEVAAAEDGSSQWPPLGFGPLHQSVIVHVFAGKAGAAE